MLFITGSFPPMLCGVGDYTGRLSAALARLRGLKIGVLTSASASPVAEPLEILPVIEKWTASALPAVVRAVQAWRADIVHIQYPTLGYGTHWMPYFLPAVLGRRVRVVQTWHEPPTRYRFFPNAWTKDVLIGVEKDFLAAMRPRYRWLVRRKVARHIPIGSNIPQVRLTEEHRAAIRRRFGVGAGSMIVNFGFAYPGKGIETLFEVADPARDVLVLIMQLDGARDPYHARLLDLAARPDWRGKVIVTGTMPAREVAEVLAAADAAVYPFPGGVNSRNGSFRAALNQGVFTLTTSRTEQGYDAGRNLYHARIGDVVDMRQALGRHLGIRRVMEAEDDWTEIARQHAALYHEVLGQNSTQFYAL